MSEEQERKRNYKVLKIIIAIVVVAVIIFSVIKIVSCVKDNNEKDLWKSNDISGYYFTYLGSAFSFYSCSLELFEEPINDNTKTFVARYCRDSYTENTSVMYVSYGYYSIENSFDLGDRIEYNLKLDYIQRDENASSTDEITVYVKKGSTYCYFGSDMMYKGYEVNP